ncbi:hypothetical protein FRC12_002695 [Ceratobasidium sp. 428]|nr:hypothetical protein FRC12_002695 [Ceratobasidium sp. 428]
MESQLRFRGPPPGGRPPGPPPDLGGMSPLSNTLPPGPPPVGFEGNGAPPPFVGGPGPPPDFSQSHTDQEFDPTNPSTSIYTNLGVWDYFTERQNKLNKVPMVKIYRRMTAGLNGAPYAWRLLKDVLELAPGLLILYLACLALNALMPAVALYYSSRMFQVVSKADVVVYVSGP